MSHKMQAAISLFAVLFCCGLVSVLQADSAVAAQQSQSSISATAVADRTELTVGDPVQVSFTVVHPAGSRVLWPALDESWGAFEVQEQQPASTVTGADGSLETTQAVLLTLWAPGEYTTPPVTLTVARQNGELEEITAPTVSVRVVSVLTDGDLALRDLKPQATLDLPFPWSSLLIGTAFLLLFGVAGYWAWQRWNRQPHTAVPPPFTDDRPAYQIALEELTRVEELDLPERARFKEHYTLITDALRRYLEEAFAVPALDRTTTEMRPALAQTVLPVALQQALLALLTEADLVKFADVRPDSAVARLLPQQAKTLVLELASAGEAATEGI